MSTTNFIVYEDGDKILGVGAIKGSHIKKVYTRFGYRDSGIGTDLTTQLEQIARRNGHDKCSVHSTQNAVGFYAKLGYQSQREIPLEPVELGETLIEMVKQI
jgi:putative acetyltransferase